ncbi:hypothetical protein PF007_g3673 [Phytophthora fragariae]|uniref:Partial AB-hydrolase lipase domain-containing protein n=1 Tax=Phytophthora fragariae TaxID=53985 RepID=A0A6A3TAE0_9STRA|nr:hypothetical protein PF007_g3673 [Phytophthora fragariae]
MEVASGYVVSRVNYRGSYDTLTNYQEMALYDMSAIINYVLTTTGHSTLCYVGNSEGTMQAFAGFSVDQELARKVSYFGALAPVAYLGHITSSIF